MDRRYNINNKEDLMSIITQSSFALDDIKLYLDTHPCDEFLNIRISSIHVGSLISSGLSKLHPDIYSSQFSSFQVSLSEFLLIIR